MEFDLVEARAVLQRTPATLDAFLRGLPADWTPSATAVGPASNG